MAASEPRFQPVELNLDRQQGLSIRWADGTEHQLPLAVLRRNCPCATCRARREEQDRNPLAVVPAAGAQREAALAADAELVGAYALRIRWRDGHDVGIFDFRRLRELAEQA